MKLPVSVSQLILQMSGFSQPPTKVPLKSSA